MTTEQPTEPRRPQPKLFTRGKVILILGALIVGATLGIVREYRADGRVSGVTIGASAAALAIGLAILYVMAWYGNKPEK
jgi:hypothetical protein